MRPRPSARRFPPPAAAAYTALPAAALLAALLAVPAPSAAASGDVVNSHWIGLGYNQNPQPPTGTTWNSADWDRMVSRTDWIEPGLVRVNLNLPWFWTGDDSGGTYDFTSDAYLNAEKVIRHYVDEGVPVVSGLFGVGTLTYTAPNTAAIQATVVKHLQDDGAAPTYWAGINEPNVDNGVKSYSYADWQTATTNLVAAFGAAGVDPGRTAVSGADTAEAGVSAYLGDLGHQTAPACRSSCDSSLVWKAAGLSTFTTRVFAADGGDSAVTFQTSPDGVTWRDLTVAAPTPVPTVTGKNGGGMWEYTYTASGITNAKYLRLSVASSPYEHSVGSMDLTGTGTAVSDPLDDLTRTQTALDTGTWSSGVDWWLRSARSGLVSASDAHFYSQELYGAAPDYVEPVLAEAVSQIRAAAPGAPVLLSETGMKALEDADGNKDYDFALDTVQPLRMADLAVQEARAGVDGAAAWCLDGYPAGWCGMWGRGDDDPGTVSAHSTALRPWFYTWSLMSRGLPGGSVVHAPAEPAGVRVLAAQLPTGGWTFVLVNRTGTAQSVRLTEPTGTIALAKYVYSSGSRPATDADGFPVPVGTLTADFTGGHNLTVGGDSVAVFTTSP
ncbi:hypothetical protein [Streptomyces sp. HPF1205]|uniref:hypothetical protein n=1 Tax=Streptomyces sp. HPF1205 TaxID=2873262 RepID=UPI001CED5EA8|nr:hypothetical protein [Streptomyces sp. HPF1205]